MYVTKVRGGGQGVPESPRPPQTWRKPARTVTAARRAAGRHATATEGVFDREDAKTWPDGRRESSAMRSAARRALVFWV
jgi:hypothetical protein